MKFQLHQSGMQMLSRCGEQFRRRFIEGERLLPRAAMARGTGVDRAVGADLGNKIATGELLPDEEIAAIARDNTEAALAGGFDLESDEERALGHAVIKGRAIDMAVSLADLHHRSVAPTIHPSHVAKRFVIDVENYDFQLAGERDIREEFNGLVGVRDTKTSTKSPQKGIADLSSQLTMYAMAEYVETGKPPDILALDYLIETKTSKKVLQLPTKRTLEDFAPLLNRVQIAVEAVQKGHFYPADPSTPGAWWCHPERCGYWSTCRYVRNPTTAQVLVQIRGEKNGNANDEAA